MEFCFNCGHPLTRNSKFCSCCGQLVNTNEHVAPKTRETILDGEIHKCLNCGGILKSFYVECPFCGLEIRGVRGTAAIGELKKDLVDATSESQKISIVQTFSVPNTREDIIEFMRLADSNFDASVYASHIDELDISDAWLAKVEQCYKKAKRSFKDKNDLAEIEEIYSNVQSRRQEKEEEYRRKQEEKALEQKRENNASQLKNGKFLYVLIGLVVLGGILTFVALECEKIMSFIIALAIMVLSFISLLLGLNIIKYKHIYFPVLLSALAIALLIPCFFFFDSNNWQISDLNPNQIKIDIASNDLFEMDCQTVQKMLYDKGFVDISIEEQPWNKDYQPGKLISVSIDGKTSFKRYQRFNKNSVIVLCYAGAPRNKLIGLTPTDLIGLTYRQATEKLQEKGFFNIEYDELLWSPNVTSEIVVHVTVDGRSDFLSDNNFSENVRIVIQYHQLPQNITVGHSYISLVDRDYKSVKDIFISEGFVNVSLEKVSWEKNKTTGCVKSVSINGIDDFGALDGFKQDSAIIIYYYDEPKLISIGYTKRDFKKEHYDDIKKLLYDMGFVNISLKKVDWEKSKTPGYVKTVSINGIDDFEASDSFKQDSAITIYYYDEPKLISIGYTIKDFKGIHYTNVTDLLYGMGFVNIEEIEVGWNLFQKSGNVKSVTINGIDDWEANDTFAQNTKIVIEYYK